MTETKTGYMTRGGNGSHWEGCESVHWDCKIKKLERENERLRKVIEMLKQKLQTTSDLLVEELLKHE